MTGFVDRILKDKIESTRRKAHAYEVLMALSRIERQDVLAEVILREEADATDAAPEKAPAVATAGKSSATFTDRAEAFVLSHPAGVKTAAVAQAIGQDVSSVDGSLRSCVKRGTVRRMGRLWVPAASKAEQKKEPKARVTIRDLINSVYAANGNTELGAAALFEALKAIEPTINKSSLDGELNRMRGASLLIQVGVGANGGGLYKLAQEVSLRST